MAVHVNGVYVVGGKSNEKGNIINIYKHEYGYYYYHTIKGKNMGITCSWKILRLERV